MSPADESSPPPADAAPSWQTLIGMGTVIGAVLLVGLGVGWFVDSQLHTTPIFVLVGLLVGLVVDVAYTISIFRRFLVH